MLAIINRQVENPFNPLLDSLLQELRHALNTDHLLSTVIILRAGTTSAETMFRAFSVSSFATSFPVQKSAISQGFIILTI